MNCHQDVKAQRRNPSPEQQSSFLCQMFFAWLDPTVWRAWKRAVTLDDLWDMNREDSVEYLFPRFDRIWRRKKQKDPNPRIAAALLETFLPIGLFSGQFFQLFYVLLLFVNPQILNLIIAFVQGGNSIDSGRFRVPFLGHFSGRCSGNFLSY